MMDSTSVSQPENESKPAVLCLTERNVRTHDETATFGGPSLGCAREIAYTGWNDCPIKTWLQGLKGTVFKPETEEGFKDEDYPSDREADSWSDWLFSEEDSDDEPMEICSDCGGTKKRKAPDVEPKKNAKIKC